MIAYIAKFTILIIILLPVYLVVRRPHEKKEGQFREIALSMFVLFMAALIILVLEGDYAKPSTMLVRARYRLQNDVHINLELFKTIRRYLIHPSINGIGINLLGNTFMFMPWGFGLCALWKKNQTLRRVLLFSLGFTIVIEFIQLFINRNVDIDDVLLNFLGSVLGALIYKFLRKKFPEFALIEK